MIPALSRAELVEIVLQATTDEVTIDEEPGVVHRPNILVTGCRRPLIARTIGYTDPDAAARVFAGRIADAVLDRLEHREAAA